MKKEVDTLIEEIGQSNAPSPADKSLSTNILVVDDEEIMRKLLTDVLRNEGYNINSVSRADDALQEVAKGNINILITDIMMKGMNGIELLKRVKDIDPDIDVIVMTGYGSIQTAVESMKLGAIDYLTKPLNIDQISLIVKKTAERRQLKREASESKFYKKLSQVDGLTELFNHRFFQQLLQKEIARAERDNSPVSLIMIDVDNFKAYNDQNGHPMGDLALKKISWLLTQNSRECDFIARYGGEEFTIIIPNTVKKIAVSIANRIRRAIEDTDFVNEDSLPNRKLTISLGVAEYPADAQSRKELIEQADQALYLAKTRGKNRVEVIDSQA
jgi:diguanylate cyclase (GGDEF)-like protein